MVHAVSAAFLKNEHMSPPAAGLALLLHIAVALLIFWAPVHHPVDTTEAPIEVTMEAPPPPEPKPVPEAPKPPPPPPPKAQPVPPSLPGLVPPGPIGPKSTAPPMERGETTRELPSQKSEKPAPKEEPAQPPPPPQQATARPAEPTPPPPPPPALEKELPPIEAPPPPVTSRDMPQFSPPQPKPEPKPEPKPQPQPQPQPKLEARPEPPRPRPAPQPLAPSPLSHLPRNTPSQRPNEPPRSTFVNPADTYAQNTAADSYLQRVAAQVSRYQAELIGTTANDYVVARFTIARNGRLLGISIVKSSGKQSLDRGLITAFQTVAPFPPLPADLPGESATFTLTFGPRFRQ